MVKFKWNLPSNKPSATSRVLASRLDLPLFITNLLVKRGVSDPMSAKRFLHPKLSDLGDPFKIHGIQEAIRVIQRAIREHLKITIYGDYDVDGLTSTSITYLLLKHFGADVHYYIPNRFKDGYGPNLDRYKQIVRDGTKLLITVDNGISGKREIAWLREHGCHCIIGDHHEWPVVNGELDYPDADAIYMPNNPKHPYHDKFGHKFTDFCGAGIALKLAQAMLGHIPAKLLELSALGTIADSVSLTSEDRIIVACGIQAIREHPETGVRAIAKVADIDLSELNSISDAFTISPRLNALGRMGDANIGVELLTTNDSRRADSIAALTEQRNRKRQKIMRTQTKEALAQAAEPQNLKKHTLVLADKHWFPGIVGIIGSRVVEEYYKPTIVIGHLKADDQAHIDRGSGRSIPEFDLFKALDPIRDTMTSFGGHPMACGLSIKPEKIQNLRDGLERAGRAQDLVDVQPKIDLALSLRPREINLHTLHLIQRLAPFGQDNGQPLIDLRIPRLAGVGTMGKTNNHLWLSFSNGEQNVRGVDFGAGDLISELKHDPYHIELAGSININHFNGRDYLQFMVSHLRHYKTNAISRHAFGNVYRFLRNHSRIDDSDHRAVIKAVSKYTGTSLKLTAFIMKVFEELGLTMSYEQVYFTDQHPIKTNLMNSKTYRRAVRRK